MDNLVGRGEGGHRRLGQPVDADIRADLAQATGDGQVAPCVAESDR